MKGISLFSGCLGLDLGMEQVGMEAVAYVENDKDCHKVMAAHRPNVPVIGDVRDLDALSVFAGKLDWLAGGFPCQDLSYAGKGAGLDGERSGLWFDMADAIRLLRPRLVIVENVPALLTRGVGRVLYDLAEAGYVGSWCSLRAADLGAPHRRERIFILARLADPDKQGLEGSEPEERRHLSAGSGDVAADADGVRDGSLRRTRRGDPGEHRSERSSSSPLSGGPEVVLAADAVKDRAGAAADTVSERLNGSGEGDQGGEAGGRDGWPFTEGSAEAAADTGSESGQSGDGRGVESGDRARGGAPERDGDRHDGQTEPRAPVEAAADTDGEPGQGGQGVHPRRGQDVGPVAADGGSSGRRGETPPDADDGADVGQRARPEPRGGSEAAAYPDGSGGEARGDGGPDSERARVQSVGRSSSATDWGVYGDAVRRWEQLTRPAPGPVDDRGRLNARFVEWMLGFPDGWVDLAGVTRTAQLRMLGNSVQVQIGALVAAMLLEMADA